MQRGFIKGPPGAVHVAFGDTRVLCTAIVEERVPPFLRDSGRGWVTAEYNMLPGSASEGRINRDAVNKGRALEISRLIGRSLRAVIDLAALGERQIIVDCDVLQADGGTRTAAITGGYVALCDTVASLIKSGALTKDPIARQCAAVSVGIVGGRPMLDLCYAEDSTADVDLNLVMVGDAIVEIQATAEKVAFDRRALDTMIDLGAAGIQHLYAHQKEALSRG